MIDKFLDYYYFLSNFYPHPIIYKGEKFKTSEHAYQAYKTLDPAEREYIKNLDTPGKAKRAGNENITVRKDWEDIKYDLMLDIVRAKFKDDVLAKLLIETGNQILIEGNWWHDNTWGDCTCKDCENKEGKNWLGKILMQVREEIKKDKERYNIFKFENWRTYNNINQ